MKKTTLGSDLFKVATFVLATTAAAACGPSVSGDDDDDDGPGGDSGVNCAAPVAEVCGNLVDDDCDGRYDCDDPDCHTNMACTTVDDDCGTLDSPTAMLELPDGACPEDENLPCAGFESALNFTGFTAGQVLPAVDKLEGICVNMEHSWMRDLVVYAECPTGVRVMLSDFEGHSGGQVYLGIPNDNDEFGTPIPGTGWDYCWRPSATNLPWIPYANANLPATLPAGDYQSSQPLNAFVGCPLNGNWKLRVEDRWGIDNGFIFSWTVEFSADLVEDCASWPG